MGCCCSSPKEDGIENGNNNSTVPRNAASNSSYITTVPRNNIGTAARSNGNYGIIIMPRSSNLQSPTVANAQVETITNSSSNTLQTIRSYGEIPVRALCNRDLGTYSNQVLNKAVITFDANYFPKASKVLLVDIELINILPKDFPPTISYKLYQCIRINEHSLEYCKIKKMITNRFFIVKGIEEIFHPLLRRTYQLKKEQRLKEYPSIKDLLLFHGTAIKNVDGICKNNLNWRYNGSNTGHCYGKGICFSCNAMYAAYYSSDAGQKVIFIFKVLVGKKVVGNGGMKLPPDGYDTTSKDGSDIVVVKYEDNEFCPMYKIKFVIAPGYTPNKKRQNIYYRKPRLHYQSLSDVSD